MNRDTLYRIETCLPTGNLKTKDVTYAELMGLFNYKSFRFFPIFSHLTYYLIDKNGNPCCVYYNGEYISWNDLLGMIEKYHRFTSGEKKKERKNAPVYRKDPIPYTGTMKSSMRLRSKEVLRNGIYQHVPRSNYKNRSWKTNHKSRKPWGKHMKNQHDQKNKHELIWEFNHEFIEEPTEMEDV